jgi:hypothetical protein
MVNFEVLMQRNTMYREKECASLKQFQENMEEQVAELARGVGRGGETLCLRKIPRSAMNVLPLKERMKILRRHMPELDPLVRSRNFEEVNLGLNVLDALSPKPRAASNAPSPVASSIARWACRSRPSWP